MPMQTNSSSASASASPHVLIFPLPLQGTVNSMLKLAEILCISDINVTFVVTDHIHSRLLRNSNVVLRFSKYPGFVLQSISDGLPKDHPRAGSRYIEMFESMKLNSKPLLKELLSSGWLDRGRGPVTCIIADGVMSFVCDVANEIGVNIFCTRTLSACSLSIFFSLPKLIEAGELPFTGGDLDTPIKNVPAMEKFLRRRDLPSFCRSDTLSGPSIQLFKNENQENARAQGLILNTFEDIEGPVLDNIRAFCPNLYTIGPLHAHLKMKLAAKSCYTASSNSLRKEDRSCMSWLDSQPYKSVIYVSFGSIATMTRDQLMEFWCGLVNSECKFLWVIRPDLIAGDGEIPEEVLEGTKERGYIVGWAPQEEVLGHPSVGGFLTHSGWNSTLESVVEGVPMICWPYFMDQQVNSRFVSEVWKLGLDMKDTCDRVIVERMVKDLMVKRKDEFLKSADRMAKLAMKSLCEGGSSYSNLERLIQDIKTISVVHKEAKKQQ
ncbi:hypothetical protein ACET3Z_029249 [Daucus carota]